MERLKGGAEQINSVQELLKKSAESNIEVIRGIDSNFNNFKENLQSAENPAPINQNVSQNDLQSIIRALENTEITKTVYGNYGAGDGGANLHNFIHVLSDMGVQWQQISSYLDEIISKQQSRQTSNLVTVAPNISINLEGNVIAERQFETDLAEKIKNEVYKGVTSAVENATATNYSFAN